MEKQIKEKYNNINALISLYLKELKKNIKELEKIIPTKYNKEISNLVYTENLKLLKNISDNYLECKKDIKSVNDIIHLTENGESHNYIGVNRIYIDKRKGYITLNNIPFDYVKSYELSEKLNFEEAIKDTILKIELYIDGNIEIIKC